MSFKITIEVPDTKLAATLRQLNGHKAMVPLAIVLAAGRSSSEGRSVALSELLPDAESLIR